MPGTPVLQLGAGRVTAGGWAGERPVTGPVGQTAHTSLVDIKAMTVLLTDGCSPPCAGQHGRAGPLAAPVTGRCMRRSLRSRSPGPRSARSTRSG